MNMKISVFFTYNESFFSEVFRSEIKEKTVGTQWSILRIEYSSLGQLVHHLLHHLLHLLRHVLLQVRPQVLPVVLLGILKLILLLCQDQLL